MSKIENFKYKHKNFISIFLISTLSISILALAYFVYKGNYSFVKSRAFTIIPASIPVQPILLTEHFDSQGSLSDWKLTQNGTTNKISISSQSYLGAGALQFDYNDYSNSQLLRADRVLSPTSVTNVVVRTAFYDDMSARKGSMFSVNNQNNENTGIGVNTNNSSTNYIFRANTAGQMYVSSVRRSLGWHIFELVVTDKGTYGKIDNTLLYKPDSTLWVNTGETQLTTISLVSTWGLFGVTRFDEITAAQMDQLSAADQIMRVQQTFYNKYKDTSFQPLYANLGNRLHANDLRGLLNTAVSFYAYGKRVSDQNAISKAVGLFNDALNNGHWDQDNDGKYWARGAYLSSLSGALNLMKPDLDTATFDKAFGILSNQIQTYILAKDDFDTTLSGWTNLSNPASINTAQVTQGVGYNGTPGLVLKYIDGSITPTGQYLVNIKKTFQSYTSAPSLKATIMFYDDMSPKKAAAFVLNYSGSTVNTGVVINTNISPSYYLFRINTPDNMKPTAIKRTPGWHKLTLSLASNCCGLSTEKIGVSGYIDGVKIGTNKTQLNADSVSLISTWGLTGTDVFDNLLITRMPDTGKTQDTKSEENGWHAVALAEAVNYFPSIPNRDILTNLAKCYAYHTITIASDPEYCETKTITAYDNFRIDNHNQLNPGYQSSSINELIRSGSSFTSTGQPIPSEFTHNLTNSYNTWITFIDRSAYQYVNSPLGDWNGAGASNTPYQSGEPDIIHFSKITSLPFSLSDFLSKRSIFFYNMVSTLSKSNPTSVSSLDEAANTGDGYFWWVDSIMSGEMLVLSGYQQ